MNSVIDQNHRYSGDVPTDLDAGEMTQQIAHPQTKQRFADIGTIAGSSTPAKLTALLKSELDKWGPVIQELGIKAD